MDVLVGGGTEGVNSVTKVVTSNCTLRLYVNARYVDVVVNVPSHIIRNVSIVHTCEEHTTLISGIRWRAMIGQRMTIRSDPIHIFRQRIAEITFEYIHTKIHGWLSEAEEGVGDSL